MEYKSIKVYDETYQKLLRLALVRGEPVLTRFIQRLADEEAMRLYEAGTIADPEVVTLFSTSADRRLG